MSWNGSGAGGGQDPHKKTTKNASLGRVHIVVGGLVIAVVGIAYWLLMPAESKNQTSQERRMKTAITEVEPSLSVTGSMSVAEEKPVVIPKLPEVEEVKRKLAPTTTNKYPRRVVKRRERPPRRFDNMSDELIAHVLEAKPGAMMVGRIPFEKYEKQFRDSIATPIKINQDDSEYDKELKKSVMDARRAIAEMIGDGQTFAEVMQTTRDELQKLGQYKASLEKELRALKKNGDVTDDDYQGFVEAANKLLESKGATPIRSPALIYRNIELREMKERLEQQ